MFYKKSKMSNKEIKVLLKGLKKYKKKVTSSKKKSRKFLIRVGIVNKNGELTQPYKNLRI